MHTFILQDWTTIRGGVATVIQGESGWLDLSAYQDVVFWLDVREASGTPGIVFQTAPTKDEVFFLANSGNGITGSATTMTASSSAAVPIKGLMAAASIPVARYVRWSITGTVTWDATFRVVVAANSPGM